MRRHLLLTVLIVAILVAIAVLRPQIQQRDLALRPSPAPVIPIPEVVAEVPADERDDPGDARSVPVPPSIPAPVKVEVPKTKRVRVAVIDSHGQPVENAVVIIMSSRDYQETYRASHRLSDKDGWVDFDVLRDRECDLIYAYKAGLGYSILTAYAINFTDAPVFLKLQGQSIFRIKCVGPDGAPLPGVSISVNFEIEFSSRYDHYGNYVDSKMVPMPVKQSSTNEQGLCELENLPSYGFTSDGKNREKGARFTITATWQGRSIEKKINYFPKDEIRIAFE